MSQRQYGFGFAWFLAGACVGAAAALMTAPQTGRRLRRMLKEKVDEGFDSVADTGQDLIERGRRLAKDSADLANRAVHLTSR